MATRHTDRLSQGASRERRPIRHWPLWLAFAAAALYWLVESLFGAALIPGLPLGSAVLAREHPGSLWSRLSAVGLILLAGVLSDHLVARVRRLEQHTRGINRLLRLLGDVNQHLQRQPSERSLLEAACQAAVRSGCFCCAWVAARNGAGLHLGAIDATDPSWLERVREEAGPRWAERCPLAAQAHEEGVRKECQLRPHGAPPPRCPEVWREGLVAMGATRALALPLHRGEEAYGALVVHDDGGEPFGEEALAILDEIAENVSTGLGNIAHRRAEEQAYAALDLRVAELERFRKASVDRELRIKALREEVERLRARLAERGGPPS